jgi:zinc protease
MFAPGDADLDLAAQILGGGKSSRLYKGLVFEQRVAQDAWAYQSSQALGSLFGLGLTAKPGQALEDVEASAMKIIQRLADDGPTEEELERARNSHLADYYKGLDSLQTRADLLNHYEYALGDPGGMAQDLARYHRATAQSVREAFATMASGKRLVLNIVPDPSAPSSEVDDDEGAEVEDDIEDAAVPHRRALRRGE